MAKFLTLFAVLLAARYYAPADKAAGPKPDAARPAAAAKQPDVGACEFTPEKGGKKGKK